MRHLIAALLLLFCAAPAPAASIPTWPHTQDPDTTAYLAKDSATPSVAWSGAVAQFVYTIKACGSWSKADWRLLLFNENQQLSLVNMMSPAQVAAQSNAPAFTALRGWSPNGSGLLTTYNPGDGGGPYNYLLADATIVAAAMGSDSSSNSFLVGNIASGIVPLTSVSNVFGVRANTATTASINTPPHVQGLYGFSKGTANTVDGYYDGVLAATAASTATGIANAPIMILTRDGTNFTNKVASYFYSGGQLTPSEEWCEWQAYSTLVTAMGATP